MHPTALTLHFDNGAKRTVELAQGTDLTQALSMLGDARRTGSAVTLYVVDGETNAPMPYVVDGPSIEAISYVMSSRNVLRFFLEAPGGDGGGLGETHEASS